jgi:hypothetical protein
VTVIVVSFFESVFADHSKDHPVAVAYLSATRSPGPVHHSAGRHLNQKHYSAWLSQVRYFGRNIRPRPR